MNGTPIVDNALQLLRQMEKRIGWLERRPGTDSDSPSGIMAPFGGAVPPSGWLLCDGSAVSRTAYANLFLAIGTTHGAGNGSTTFNLPNIKGRVVVGRDTAQTEFDTVGEVGGEKAHTLTVAEMPSHFHQDPTTTGGAGSYELAGLPPTNPNAGYDYGAQSAPTSSTGGGGAHNNLQPYIVLPWIIRA